jgi:hypothetical protein
MYLFRAVFYFILLLPFTLISIAEVVSVHKVKFTSLQDDWLMSEVEIHTGSNTLVGASSARYVENVGVHLYLGFKNVNTADGVDYFYSDAEAMILEKGDKNTVRFYIPGKEIEMNRYHKPDYFYAELTANQIPISPQRSAFSSNLQNEGSLNNFVRKAKVRSIDNFGRLMPSYLAPLKVVGNDPDAPAYLRVENKSREYK